MKKLIILITVLIAVVGLSITSYALMNHAPRANAGADFMVLSGDAATLDGTGSFDPNGDVLSYKWAQIAGPMVTLTEVSPGISITSPLTAPANTTLTFALRVFDGQKSSSDLISVTINSPSTAPLAATGINQSFPITPSSQMNLAPKANAGANFVISPGGAATLDGTGSFDPNGDLLSYKWAQIAGPMVTLTEISPGISITSPLTAPANTTLTFALRVFDGQKSSSDLINVTINNPSTAPLAATGVNQSFPITPRSQMNLAPRANTGADFAVLPGNSAYLDGRGSFDPNGDLLSYKWVQLAGPMATITEISPGLAETSPLDASVNTTLTFALRVFDGQRVSSDIINVTIKVTNTAPVAIAGLNLTVGKQQIVTLNGSASYDPDLDQLTYDWMQITGPTVLLDISNPALPTFISPSELGGSRLTFELIVDDGVLMSMPATVTVFVAE